MCRINKTEVEADSFRVFKAKNTAATEYPNRRSVLERSFENIYPTYLCPSFFLAKRL